MGATLLDVARAAGVSRSTASRALSGHPAVRKETRELVEKVANQLGYQADPVARALRAGSSKLVGLIVTNLRNPSIHTIAETIQSQLHNEGYELIIAISSSDPERERQEIRAMASRRVDGLLVMGTNRNAAFLNSILDAGIPIVPLIRAPQGLHAPCIVYDDEGAGRLSAEHLLSLGHRKFCIIAGPTNTQSGRERVQGFIAALRKNKISKDAIKVIRAEFDASAGNEAGREYLAIEPRPTGLVIANHEVTFSVLKTLLDSNTSVPAKVSVVAVEDETLLQYWHPPITTIDMNPQNLATRAVRALLAQLQGITDTSSEAASLSSQVKLIKRESTAEIICDR